MKKETIMLIVNYKQQLAELDRYYWFEDMPEHEYLMRFEAIKERLNKLEQKDD
tara:strand:+ start:250 stop:408 length:159 start_codon:yes stop_codon:yes gene_type:complete